MHKPFKRLFYYAFSVMQSTWKQAMYEFTDSMINIFLLWEKSSLIRNIQLLWISS